MRDRAEEEPSRKSHSVGGKSREQRSVNQRRICVQSSCTVTARSTHDTRPARASRVGRGLRGAGPPAARRARCGPPGSRLAVARRERRGAARVPGARCAASDTVFSEIMLRCVSRSRTGASLAFFKLVCFLESYFLGIPRSSGCATCCASFYLLEPRGARAPPTNETANEGGRSHAASWQYYIHTALHAETKPRIHICWRISCRRRYVSWSVRLSQARRPLLQGSVLAMQFCGSGMQAQWKRLGSCCSQANASFC